MNVYVSNIVVLMSPHYSFDGQSNDGYDGASKTWEQGQMMQNGVKRKGKCVKDRNREREGFDSSKEKVIVTFFKMAENYLGTSWKNEQNQPKFAPKL